MRVRSSDNQTSRRRRKQVGRQVINYDEVQEMMQRIAPLSKHLRSPHVSYHTEKILHVITLVTHGCFDSHGWTFDNEAFVRPSTLQYCGVQLEHVAQQLYTAGANGGTVQNRKRNPALATSLHAIAPLAEPRFDTILWGLLILRGIVSMRSHPRRRHFLQSVLAYLKGVSEKDATSPNPMRDFFTALALLEPEEVQDICRIGFSRLYLELESVIGTTNAGIIMFWSDISEYFGRDLPAKKMQHVVNSLRDRDERFGRLSYKSMFVLRSTWEQIAASQPTVANTLVEELNTRFLEMFATDPVYIYDWRVSGFRNAIHHRAENCFDAGDWGGFRAEYERLFDIMEQADKECIERALTDLDHLINKLTKAYGDQPIPDYASLLARKISMTQRLHDLRTKKG
jgi:hypothetical protein